MLAFKLAHSLAEVRELLSYLLDIVDLFPFMLFFSDYILFILSEESGSNFVREE